MTVDESFKFANARAETLEDKKVWKRLLDRRRCILPASGFYEWKTVADKKIPYLIRPTTTNYF
jgi:putative SOS response-associated peptidase YedK